MTARPYREPRLGTLVVESLSAAVEPLRAFLRATEERLDESFGTGGLALTDARDRAHAMDHAIETVLHAALNETPATDLALPAVTLVATGGYGRAELSPGSDLDLLFLVEEKRGVALTPAHALAERFLYPLWDAGLKVGHSVRTIAECVEVARSEMTTRSALLDHRYITGSKKLYARFEKALDRRVFQKDRPRFVRFKLEEIVGRRDRMGDAVYRNEPDLKEGEGGLRDAQTVIWIGRTVWRIREARGLVSEHVAARNQIVEYDNALEFILRVRRSLHKLAGRRDDRLSFSRQKEIAHAFGYTDGEEGLAPELFMRDLLRHQSAVQQLLDDLVDALPGRYRPPDPGHRTRSSADIPKGFRLREGRLAFAGFGSLAKRPVDILRAFEGSAATGLRLHPVARVAIREQRDAIDDSVRNAPAAATAFLNILQDTENGAWALATMNALGVLGRFMPEFEPNFCRVQYDTYHVYTVDAHSIQAVREIHRLINGDFAQKQGLLTDICTRIPRIPIILGVFLHDIGKGHGKGHVATGVRLLGSIGPRLGLTADAQALISFLIAEHLLMSHVAQRRDLSDPKTIADFVDRVGTLERLRALYVLTFADIKGVGPDTWSDWKGSLLQELYLRSLEVLSAKEGAGDPHAAAKAQRARQVESARAVALGQLTPLASMDEARAFLDLFEERYLSTTLPNAIVDDFRLMRGFDPRDGVRVGARVLPQREGTELSIYTKDRHGLFADVSGVLAASGLSIRSARIHTTRDGFALDRFEVASADGSEGHTELRRLDKIANTLRSVLAGEAHVADLLRTQRAPWASPGAPPTKPPRVDIDNTASDHFGIIDVYASDRPRLLFDITRTIADAGLDIAVAIVSTKVDQIADTFYLRTADGSKPHREMLSAVAESIGGVLVPG